MRRIGVFGWGIVAPRSPNVEAFARHLLRSCERLVQCFETPLAKVIELPAQQRCIEVPAQRDACARCRARAGLVEAREVVDRNAVQLFPALARLVVETRVEGLIAEVFEQHQALFEPRAGIAVDARCA